MTVISFEDAKKNLGFLTSSLFTTKKEGTKTTAQLLSEAFKALSDHKKS
jgi:hypothetical protein